MGGAKDGRTAEEAQQVSSINSIKSETVRRAGTGTELSMQAAEPGSAVDGRKGRWLVCVCVCMCACVRVAGDRKKTKGADLP